MFKALEGEEWKTQNAAEMEWVMEMNMENPE